MSKSNVIDSGKTQNPATTTASDGKTSIPTSLRNTAISEIAAGQKDFDKVQEYTNKAMQSVGALSARILRVAQAAMECATALRLDGDKTITQGKALFKLALDDGKAALLASVGAGDNAKAEKVHAYIEYLDSSSTAKQVRSNLNGAISKGINLIEKDKQGAYVFQTEGAVRKAVEALKPAAVVAEQTPDQKAEKAIEATAAAIVPVKAETPEAGNKLRVAIQVLERSVFEAYKLPDTEDQLVAILGKASREVARMVADFKSEGPGAASSIKAA